jgi:hypothetical protein
MNQYEGHPVGDRSAKVRRRKNRMPVNGIAMKRLLNERAATAQRIEVRSSDTYEVQL